MCPPTICTTGFATCKEAVALHVLWHHPLFLYMLETRQPCASCPVQRRCVSGDPSYRERGTQQARWRAMLTIVVPSPSPNWTKQPVAVSETGSYVETMRRRCPTGNGTRATPERCTHYITDRPRSQGPALRALRKPRMIQLLGYAPHSFAGWLFNGLLRLSRSLSPMRVVPMCELWAT